MRHRTTVLAAIAISSASLGGGCATVTAKKGGDGIPFYPSRPYLLITKNFPTSPVKTTKTTTTKPDGTKVEEVVTEQPPTVGDNQNLYSYQILYLPDLVNRYGLKLAAGLGTATANFTIADGWKLTSLNATADSKTAENLTALGGLVSAVAPLIHPAVVDEPPAGDKPKENDASIVLYEMNVKNGSVEFRKVFEGKPFMSE